MNKRQKVGAGETAPNSHKPRHVWRNLFIALAVIMALGLGAAYMAYERIGRTPGELMDYTERRLDGHPKLEVIALPVISLLRSWLNEPSRKERMAMPFVVPPPPPLNKTALTASDTPPSNDPRILRVGKHEPIRTIAEAAKLAKDGDTVEIWSDEYYGDVAVWMQKKLTIRGIGGNARLHAAGRAAESKAIWVIRNGDFTIENIDFIGVKVHDKNGAGIRFENGRLRIVNCLFWGNENGLLTTGGANHNDAELEIENSEFAYNGVGDGLSHNIYVGGIRSLRVTGSYFHHANIGHLLKSRAKTNEIKYNRLTDESGGRASYEIDLPNGGMAHIVGNIIQQNRETENSAMVSYGAEGNHWPENKLYVASNTLANDHPYGGTFLRVAPGAQSVVTANNLLVGKGGLQINAPQQSNNDIRAEWADFAHAVRQDYRLSQAGAKLTYLPPATDPQPLTPDSEYLHPRQVNKLKTSVSFAGALQTQTD